MAMHSVTVELDDETLRSLGALGEPAEVLVSLATSAADSLRGPGKPQRAQTDESLRVERHETDTRLAKNRNAAEAKADEVVRVARQTADQVVETARDAAERKHPLPPTSATEAGIERARELLVGERAQADEALEHQRSDQRRHRASALEVERETTDKDLTSERVHADSSVVDLREANAQMVAATIRAQEAADEAEVARQQAELSARELVAVAEFREMFIGILGHDLRTPLSAISMSAGNLLRAGQLDERDQRVVARIIGSTQRMTRMITQLLDLTRARLGGGLPLDRQPVELREVCRGVVEEFETPIALDLDGDLTGSWDADRLAEVLSNLAGNAIQYAAPGTPVTLSARADGPDVVAEVSNQGDPIPADMLPYIFEPFRRGKRDQSAGGNLGLGLYIAKQIVLAHGGTLEGGSHDGTTTFVMRLPRQPPPVAQSA